jgi:hypothetical protein
MIGTEMIGALNREDRRQSAAGAVYPTFDGADGAAADLCGFLIGETGGTDQDERFALFGGQLFERLRNSSISRWLL